MLSILVEVGESAVQMCLEFLGDASPSVVEAAAVALGEVARSGKVLDEDVDAVGALLSSDSPTTRHYAAGLLGEIGSAGEPYTPAIAKLIGDSDLAVQRQALDVLLMLSFNAAPAIPELHSTVIP